MTWNIIAYEGTQQEAQQLSEAISTLVDEYTAEHTHAESCQCKPCAQERGEALLLEDDSRWEYTKTGSWYQRDVPDRRNSRKATPSKSVKSAKGAAPRR